MSPNRTMHATAASILGLNLSCAFFASEPALKLCPSIEELPPKVELECNHQRAALRYGPEIVDAMARAVPSWPGEMSIRLNLIYTDGPRVESVCYTDLSGTHDRALLERVARRAATVPPPALSCFAGHRLEIRFNSKR